MSPTFKEKSKFFLHIEDDKVVDANFKAFGGVLCIASCDLAAEMIVGKTLDQVENLTNQDFCAEMLDVDEKRKKASVICEGAIKNALIDYQKKLEKLKN